MSLLQRLLSYTTDPEVVAGFQRACGIIYTPDPVEYKEGNLCNSELSRHQNGLTTFPVMNGKTPSMNASAQDTDMSSSSGELQSNRSSDSESHLKHRNGLVKNLGSNEEPKLRKSANDVVRTGTVPFRIENRFLYYLFCFGAQLGNAVFYITFFSVSFWNFDSYVARRITLVWCVCMYFGQATKDIVRTPRPKTPPVVRLETRYELEYGMPSTHAIVGCAIPFSMLIFTSGRYEYPVLVGLLVAISWCVLVCLSRIYLGMHNILDVIVGLLFAVVIMTFMVPFVDPLDEWLITSPMSPFVVLSLPVILTLLYPTLDKWSTARGDTTLILAITAGIFFGTWLNYMQGFMSPNDASLPFALQLQYNTLLLGGLRLISGVALTVSTLTSMKVITYKFLCYFFDMDPKDPKTKQTLVIELPYKYLSYFATSVNTVYTAPLMFHALGIQRMSYYTEI